MAAHIDLESLRASCGGRVCNFSGKPHDTLTGIGSGGGFKRAKASIYPQEFCRAVVKAATKQRGTATFKKRAKRDEASAIAG